MKLFENGVGRPSNETKKKRKTLYIVISVVAAVVVVTGIITGGYFILKSNSTIDIEGKDLNASTKTFYCKINNAYGNSKKLKELKKLYTYGECHSTSAKLSSVTTYYMDKNNNTLGSVPTVAYYFNHRTVNTTKSVTDNWLVRIGSLGITAKADYVMKVKICAKDLKGNIVCSSVKTLKFN